MGAGEDILGRLDIIEAKIDRLLADAGVGVAIASDDDLNSKYGDPIVKFTPRDWKGADYKNCNYSTTEPAFLQMLADALMFFAGRADDPQKKQWNLRDAGRALGWKRRLEAGWKSDKASPSGGDFGADDGDAF
jgi:hypothetical protein